MQSMPDIAALMKLANSPAGQKLLAILSTKNPEDLKKAAAAASSGNMDTAKESLSGLLESPEIQSLLKQLEKSI